MYIWRLQNFLIFLPHPVCIFTSPTKLPYCIYFWDTPSLCRHHMYTAGWLFRLCQTSRWHVNKSCVLVHGRHTKTELLFWCQQVWHNDHPVHPSNPNYIRATIFHSKALCERLLSFMLGDFKAFDYLGYAKNFDPNRQNIPPKIVSTVLVCRFLTFMLSC